MHSIFCIFKKKKMKKYIYLFLLSLFVIACSDSNTNQPIDNLSISEHIDLIKSHENKIEISFEELPEISKSYINSLENNISAERIYHAEGLGYEVEIRRESRSLISLLNMIFIYFDQEGEILFDDEFDEDNNGEYDVFNEWESFMCFDVEFPISVNMPDGSELSISNEDELLDAAEAYYEMSEEYDGNPEINYPINIIFYSENENGIDTADVVPVANQEELLMYFELCDEGWMMMQVKITGLKSIVLILFTLSP